jgi:hypothetical protein
MAKQVDVYVEDISTDEHGRPTELTGTNRILTYKSFLYLNANPDNLRYKLIGEVASVDSEGNVKLAPGNPNLGAQHRPAPQQGANLAASTGQSESEKDAEIARLRAQLAQQGTGTQNVPHETKVTDEPQRERKKPGPKRKVLTETEITA